MCWPEKRHRKHRRTASADKQSSRDYGGRQTPEASEESGHQEGFDGAMASNAGGVAPRKPIDVGSEKEQRFFSFTTNNSGPARTGKTPLLDQHEYCRIRAHHREMLVYTERAHASTLRAATAFGEGEKISLIPNTSQEATVLPEASGQKTTSVKILESL